MKGGRELPEDVPILPTPAQPLSNTDRSAVTAELDLLIANYCTLLEIEPLPNLHARRRKREAMRRAEREIQRLEELLSW